MGSVPDLDDWALAPYVREIAHQRDAALIATDQFNAAVAADEELVQRIFAGEPGSNRQDGMRRILAAEAVSADERFLVNRDLFAAVQSILTAAAMISKFLLGWRS